MKKVLLLMFAITLSFGVFAQDSAMHKMDNMQHHDMKSHDGIMMKNGKVMVMENGQSTVLTQDKTLSNGTVISANGNVKMSDGTTKMLKDGDWVGMDGKMGSMKWKNKDKMSSDSLK